jgi:alpha-tubulin suppressor-like RCC1 family protein
MSYTSKGTSVVKQMFMEEWELIDRYSGSELWSWGLGTSGQMGDNTIIDRSSPVQTISGGTNWKQVSCGNLHTAAIKTDGTLWVWGGNSNGQLGENSAVTLLRSSPVQTISGGTNWKQAEGGAFFSGAIKTDGSLWMWGSGGNGQLGDNTSIAKSSPVQTISGGTNWKQVSCGYYFTAAIKTDGTLWTWGNNTNGDLGDGTVIGRSSPVQTICGGTNWKQVSCGGQNHMAAIKTDGTLWLWGLNTDGRLGDNTVISRSSPVQTICGGTNWSQVSCGTNYSGAIKTDGTLWVWGSNLNGRIGDNTIIDRSSPVQTISGGTNWKQLFCFSQTAAIKTDGTLWVWGNNSTSGRVGDNTIIDRSSPVQTISGGTNWKQVSCGSGHTAAIKFSEYNF